MEIKIKLKERRIGILEYITLILIGIFVTSLIFALMTRYLGEYGVYMGLATNGFLVFCGYYYLEKGSKLRVITWSILGTMIFSIIAFLSALKFITSSLGDL